MAKSVTCDNCDATVDLTNDEDRMWWFKLGFQDDTTDDACSPECAHALIDDMAARKAEVIAAVEAGIDA